MAAVAWRPRSAIRYSSKLPPTNSSSAPSATAASEPRCLPSSVPRRRRSATRKSPTFSLICGHSEKQKVSKRWRRTRLQELLREASHEREEERQEQTAETLLPAQFYPNRSHDGGDPRSTRLLAQREACLDYADGGL